MSYNENLQSNNDALRDILDEVNALPNGTGGVQADWNQSDPAAPDYIKNRTHYEEIVEDEITVEFDGVNPVPDTGIWASLFERRTEATYIIDGVECVYSGEEYIDEESTMFRVNGPGFPNYAGASCWISKGSNGIIIRNNGDGSYMPGAISFLGDVKIVHKLDPKYLPDAVQMDYEQNEPTAKDYIKNRPFYEEVLGEPISRVFDGLESINDVAFCTELFERRREVTVVINDSTFVYAQDQSAIADMLAFEVSNGATSYVVLFASGKGGGDINGASVIVPTSGTMTPATITLPESKVVHPLDPKYLTSMEPYVIDAEAYTYGDDALAAILAGRQIYVKVPSQNPGGLYANFMPVIQYQLPQSGNDYLTLIYLKDGLAQNIMTALQTGSFDAVYGQIVMLLSQSYDDCPLKVSPIK